MILPHFSILTVGMVGKVGSELRPCTSGFGSKMGQIAYPMGFPSHPMGKMGMNQVQK